MKLTEDVAASVETIRSGADNAYAAVRARTELTAAAKAVLIAKAYLKGSTDLKALRQRAEAEYTNRCAALATIAFGVADLASNSVDRAAASMNLRDAQRRVDEIVNGDSINKTLSAKIEYDRAKTVGDELMMRALAETAWNRPELNWGDAILMPFVADRPAADAALGELRSLLAPSLNAMSTPDLFAWVFLKPIELDRFNDYQIADIAGGNVTGQAWPDGLGLTNWAAQ